MKKYVIAAALIAVITGCKILGIGKKSYQPGEFQVQHDVILYKGKPYARLQAMTWSLDGGELVKEMNFELLDKDNLTPIGPMIDFLSDRHNGDEIEVEFAVDKNSDQFKL